MFNSIVCISIITSIIIINTTSGGGADGASRPADADAEVGGGEGFAASTG